MSANRTGERLQIYLPGFLMSELRKRSDASRRTLTAEIELALIKAWGITEEPKPEPPPPPPKRPVGRPRRGA